jgi:lysozyme family protein
MKSNFDRALEFVLKWEGGYSNDPHDPGGETKYGINKASHPNVDIKNLTLEQAAVIYKNEYWDTCNCDDLKWPLDIIVFDTAVNMGQKRAMIFLQENESWQDYLFSRIGYYIKISPKTKDRYLKGWINRVLDLFKEIKKWGYL